MADYRMGLDIGSTTVKAVVLDDAGHVCYSKYERHNAHVPQTLAAVFAEIGERLKDGRMRLNVTGSVGLGIAERSKIDQMVKSFKTGMSSNIIRISVSNSKYPPFSLSGQFPLYSRRSLLFQ